MDYLTAKSTLLRVKFSMHFEFSSWYYYTCKKFQDCCLPNLEENYCFICQIKVEFNAYEIEKIIESLKFIEIYKLMKKQLRNV